MSMCPVPINSFDCFLSFVLLCQLFSVLPLVFSAAINLLVLPFIGDGSVSIANLRLTQQIDSCIHYERNFFPHLIAYAFCIGVNVRSLIFGCGCGCVHSGNTLLYSSCICESRLTIIAAKTKVNNMKNRNTIPKLELLVWVTSNGEYSKYKH